VIHYHGGPIWPRRASIALWKKRHGFVSFYRPDQIDIAAEQCQSFALDNGAFSFWKKGKGRIDVPAYADWISQWSRHPGFDWCLIPDVIDGTETENDALIEAWLQLAPTRDAFSVPVWHLHESLSRLVELVATFPRVALGSSGRWRKPGTKPWWDRISHAMEEVCDADGFPKAKLHGLRMLNPTITSQLPLASADSTNVAQNIGKDQNWRGPYAPRSRVTRALIVADNVEHHPVARRWSRTRGLQQNLELLG
jgi:hypothetical protein